jgi:hypothetical protein
MSLTGTPFQILTIATAVLVTAGAVLLWNRVRGPRVVRVFSRIGLLLAGYALSAVAVLVSINIAYGGLIATWSDLFDTMSAHGVGQRGGGNFGHSRAMCGGKPPAPWAGGASTRMAALLWSLDIEGFRASLPPAQLCCRTCLPGIVVRSARVKYTQTIVLD